MTCHLYAVLAVFASSAAAQPATPSFDTVRVCAGGDVTLGTNLDTSWTRAEARRLRAARMGGPLREPDSLVAPLRPLFGDADYVLVNVEGAIGEGNAPTKCGPRSSNCYVMRQPISAASALRSLSDSGVVIGNVANNHSGDAGSEGFHATVNYLIAAGVHVIGRDTIAVPVASAGGDTVAFLGFSTSSGPDPRDLDAVRRHVARAAAEYARVVVTMHMGAEGPTAQRTRDVTEMFLGLNRGNPVAFAHTAVDAGADLVVGHGPHVMRAAEWRGDALIFYSLGNLLTYGPFSVREPSNRAAVVCVALDADGKVIDARLRSTRQLAAGMVIVDVASRAAVLVDSLSRLDFPESSGRVLSEAVIGRREQHR